MRKVTESIFSGDTAIIPMAEVQYIERDKRPQYKDGIFVVLSGSTWNDEIGAYNNAPFLRGEEAEAFRSAWCRYRYELENETIVNIMEPAEETTAQSLTNSTEPPSCSEQDYW